MTEVKEDPKKFVTNVYEWTPAKIKENLINNNLSEDEGETLFLDYQLKGNLYDMDAVSVKNAYQRGRLNDIQVEKWLDRKENPVWWWSKELGQSAVKGVERAVENTASAFNELPVVSQTIDAWNWLTPFPIKKKADVTWVEEPETKVGEVVATVSQFATDFIPASRAVEALSLGSKLMKTSSMIKLTKEMPKLAGFMEASFEGMVAGAAADYSAFDPFQGRAVDMLDEIGVLPEFLQFMATNPDNPAPLERLKNVLEGAALGGAFEAILFGIKGLKGAAYQKYFGNMDALAQEINNSSRLSKAFDEAYVAELDRLGKSKAGVSTPEEKIVDPAASQGVKHSEIDNPNPKIAAKRPQMGSLHGQDVRSFKIFKKIVEGAEPEIDLDNFMVNMEKFPDAQTAIRHIYDEASDIIEKERKSQSNITTEKLASTEIKKLAGITGGDPEAIMNQMRNIYGDVKGATQRVRVMYKTLATYADGLTKMCKEWDGSAENTLRIIEHMKAVSELQTMCYGARSESGRLLQMHDMKISKARFDFSEFKAMKDLPDYVQNNKDKFEKLIKDYSDKGGVEDKLKFTRFLGKGGIANWLLSHSQAAKLWSPVTHLVNSVSQTGAVMFRMAAKSFSDVALSVQKLDPVYMKQSVAELSGLGQALKVCFENPLSLKNIRKGIRPDNLTWKQALMKDPEIGTFYKSFFGREGVIDPSVKWDHAEAAFANSKLAKVGRVIDAIHKLPFNALSGADEVFKTIGTQMEYYRRVYREGIEMGYRGSDLDGFAKQALKKGRPDYFNEAIKAGKEVTFQDDLGKMAKNFEKTLNSHWTGLLAKTFFMPFYKTTINLTKFAAKNSILGLGSKAVRANLMGGGAEMYETIARISMGSAALYWGWNKYAEGKITGRLPADQRDILRAAGVQEYSIYNEKTREWVSLRRGDPFAMWLGLAADVHMAYDVYEQYKAGDMETEFSDVAAALVMAAVEPSVNSTWARGLLDLTHLFDKNVSMKQVKQTGLRAVEGMLPATTGWGWAQSEFVSDDPYVREVNSMIDVIYKKLDPTKLIPKRDPIYGKPIEREDRWLHAVNKRTMTEDPVMLEMVRVGANIREPKDYLQQSKVRLDLTPKELDEYEEIYSKLPVKDVLTTIINSKGYQMIGDDKTKADILKSQVTKFREIAKKQYITKHPERIEDIKNKLLDKADAIMGFHTAKDSSTALYNWDKYTR